MTGGHEITRARQIYVVVAADDRRPGLPIVAALVRTGGIATAKTPVPRMPSGVTVATSIAMAVPRGGALGVPTAGRRAMPAVNRSVPQ